MNEVFERNEDNSSLKSCQFCRQHAWTLKLERLGLYDAKGLWAKNIIEGLVRRLRSEHYLGVNVQMKPLAKKLKQCASLEEGTKVFMAMGQRDGVYFKGDLGGYTNDPKCFLVYGTDALPKALIEVLGHMIEQFEWGVKVEGLAENYEFLSSVMFMLCLVEGSGTPFHMDQTRGINVAFCVNKRDFNEVLAQWLFINVLAKTSLRWSKLAWTRSRGSQREVQSCTTLDGRR